MIQLIPFLHVCCCSVFLLVPLFILHAIGLSLFFNAFWHQACLSSLLVSLLLNASPFLTLLYYSYCTFLGIKRLFRF